MSDRPAGRPREVRPSATGARARHLWPSLGALTLLSYNTWLLWRPLNIRPAIFDGYLSELSASDQPYSFFFRGGDLITAVIVLALAGRTIVLSRRRTAAVAERGGPRPGRWWVVAWSALLIFGVSTFFDAFFAMDCSPTLSETCRVAEETGRLSTIHYAHTFTSVGAQVGIVASMIATAIAMVRAPRPSRTRTRVVIAIAAFEVVALVVMMIMLVLRMPGLGYPQAVMVVVASLWFAAIGFQLVGEDAVPRRRAGTSTSGPPLVGSDHG